MKVRALHLFSAAVLLSASAGAALAQPGPPLERPGPGFHRPGGGPPAERIAEILELSEEQKAQWQSLHEELAATMRPLMEERRSLHQEVRAALESEDRGACAIGEKMLAIHDLGEQQRAAREDMRDRVNNLLTPEQQIKFEALHSAREERWKRGPMGGRPFGRGPHHGPGWEQ